MEPTLWRWSIGVQISSLALIVAFFLVLQRSLPHATISSWVRGWVFNFLSIAAALAFWMLGTTQTTRPMAYFLYMAPKCLAVLYLVQGAWSLHRPGTRLVAPPQLVVAGLLFPLFGAWAFTSIDLLGVGQQLFIGLMFVPTGLALLRSRERALGWLAVGFLVRGGLCLVEAAAYASQLAHRPRSRSRTARASRHISRRTLIVRHRGRMASGPWIRPRDFPSRSGRLADDYR